MDYFHICSTIVPSYVGSVFVMKDFDKLPDTADPLFGEPVLSGGLKWRIKVYPVFDKMITLFRGSIKI